MIHFTRSTYIRSVGNNFYYEILISLSVIKSEFRRKKTPAKASFPGKASYLNLLINSPHIIFHISAVKNIRSISHIQTFLFSSIYLVSFHQGIQGYHQKFKKIHVNVPKSHLSLQYNFKKNTLRNIKRISHCNDKSVKPTSFTEAIFVIISTFSTVLRYSESTFLFSCMSSVGHP